MLTAELIELDVFVENPTEAISRAGNLLVSIGSCSSSYVEAMIRRETIYPTAFNPGFAIPHGTVSDLALVSFASLSIVRLAAPIPWHGVDVRVVFGLAARPGENLNILGKVADVAQSPDHWGRLLASRDEDEVLQLLQ